MIQREGEVVVEERRRGREGKRIGTPISDLYRASLRVKSAYMAKQVQVKKSLNGIQTRLNNVDTRLPKKHRSNFLDSIWRPINHHKA